LDKPRAKSLPTFVFVHNSKQEGEITSARKGKASPFASRVKIVIGNLIYPVLDKKLPFIERKKHIIWQMPLWNYLKN
jgi:hypothetical protein